MTTSSTLDEEISYRAPTVCDVVGITYRQLDYWARLGFVSPSVAEARGSGTQRLYSFEDLVELRLLRELLGEGRNLRSCRRALVAYRYERDRRGSGDGLLLISDPVVRWEAVDEAEIDVERITVVTILSTDWLRAELRDDLARVGAVVRAQALAAV